jgi:hypothetical protein
MLSEFLLKVAFDAKYQITHFELFLKEKTFKLELPCYNSAPPANTATHHCLLNH